MLVRLSMNQTRDLGICAQFICTVHFERERGIIHLFFLPAQCQSRYLIVMVKKGLTDYSHLCPRTRWEDDEKYDILCVSICIFNRVATHGVV